MLSAGIFVSLTSLTVVVGRATTLSFNAFSAFAGSSSVAATSATLVETTLS